MIKSVYTDNGHCPIIDEPISDEIEESEACIKLAYFFDRVWARLDDEPSIDDYYLYM